MTGRFLIKWVITFTLFWAVTSMAWAGLGSINVRSNYGEPFHADIDLSGYKPADLETLKVGFADIDAFKRLNIDYQAVLSSFHFSIVPTNNGGKVRIYSTSPINDPYLQFVLQVRASGGANTVKAFTVFLDPNSYSTDRSPINDGDVDASNKAPLSTGSNKAKAALGKSSNIIKLRYSTSLRELARKIQPSQATTDQTIAALLRANAKLSIKNDAVLIRAGTLVVIPNSKTIRSLTDAQVASALDGFSVGASDNAVNNNGPKSNTNPSTMVGDMSKQSSQLAELQKQILDREQAVKDANTKITALEQQLKSIQSKSNPGVAASDPSAAPHAPLVASAPADTNVVKPAIASAPVTPIIKKPVPHKIKVIDVAPPVEKSWLDTVIDNAPYIAAGLLLVLLALAIVVIRKRRRSSAAVFDVSAAAVGAAAIGKGASPSLNTGAPIVGGNSFMANFTQSAGAIDAAEVDPVAEAEVYIAYGRDAQAEEILKDALLKDPSRHEVRMKLLELYAARPDARLFEPLAREMFAAFDGKGPLWAKTASLGLAIDPLNSLYQAVQSGNAPVVQAAVVAPVASSQVAGAFDLDEELFGTDSSKIKNNDVVANLSLAQDKPLFDMGGDRSKIDKPDQLFPIEDAPIDDDPLRAALFDDVAGHTDNLQPAADMVPAAELPDLAFDLDSELGFDLADSNTITVGGDEPPKEGSESKAEQPAENNLLDFDFNLSGLALESNIPTSLPDDNELPAILEIPEDIVSQSVSTGFESLYEDMIQSSTAAASVPNIPEEASPPLGNNKRPASPVADAVENPLETKLDLAKVYLDMGDKEGAKEVLHDLLLDASGALKEEAESILEKLGD